MAFRSSSSTSFTGTTSLTASAPTGVTAGDYLGAILSQNATTPTLTPPSGWTQQGGTANDLTVDGQTIRYYDKIATGSDSYAWTSSSTGETTIQVFALSGRASSGAQIVLSSSNVANTSVVSIGATGLTAPANADLVWLVASDQVTSTDTWAYTPPTGFTEQQDSSTSTTSTAVTIATKDAVSAGATGTITGSCTITSGTERMGWGAFIVAVPILGPTITQQPVSAKILDSDVATFTVSATGTGGLSYQWKNNGSNVGTSSATYSQVAYVTDNSDRITVDVTDSNGTTTSSTAILSVAQRYYPKTADSLRSPRFNWSGAGSFDIRGDARGWFNKWLMQAATSNGPDVTLSITGNTGTSAVGTLAAGTVVAVTGGSSSTAAGSVVATRTIAVTGNAATSALGSLSPSSSVVLTGGVSVGSAGTVGPQISIGLTGQGAAASPGAVAAAIAVALTGGAASGAVGTLSPALVIALSSIAGTGAVGTVSAGNAVTVAITGVSATASAGSLGPLLTLALTGAAGTGSAGSVTPANGVTLALTGVSATGAVGSVAVARVVAVSGSAGTGQVGALTPGLSFALSGLSATGAAGSVFPAIVAALIGNQATGAAGALAAFGGASFQIGNTEVWIASTRSRVTWANESKRLTVAGPLNRSSSIKDH